jgi:hypothetical protein
MEVVEVWFVVDVEPFDAETAEIINESGDRLPADLLLRLFSK